MEKNDKDYINFAANISFFKPVYDELKSTNRNYADYLNEIQIIEKNKEWTVSKLADLIREHPRTLNVFESILQMSRFSNVQLIHFAFDVDKLNSKDIDSIYEYAMYNLKKDSILSNIFLKEIKEKDLEVSFKNLDKLQIAAAFKISISNYLSKLSKDKGLLPVRIKTFDDSPERIANYLLDKLKLGDILKSINIENYLKYKRIPKDTKSLHGTYAKDRLKKILESLKFKNLDNEIKERTFEKTFKPSITPSFCTERSIKGINTGEAELKVFDFVIFTNNKPMFLIELNFYSTNGTKIGINEGEYIKLYNSIKDMKEVRFFWITDGNYWLTTGGHNRLKKLFPKFNNVYNLNTFSDILK